jgi:DNA-binding transcriptional ArsR family regulator
MGNDVDEVLAALSEPIRRRVLEIIVARGEATATMISAELPISRQAIVKHLGILERAGLVGVHRQGREMLHSVRPEKLERTSRWMAELADAWDTRLAMIKRLAEDDEDG